MDSKFENQAQGKCFNIIFITIIIFYVLNLFFIYLLLLKFENQSQVLSTHIYHHKIVVFHIIFLLWLFFMF